MVPRIADDLYHDLLSSDETLTVRAEVRAFAEEHVAPVAAELAQAVESVEAFPHHLFRRMADVGLFTIPFAVLATGGVSHDPAFLFPAIHDVSPEWRPHHLLGTKQSDVPRQTWIEFEIAAHHAAATMLANAAGQPLERFSLIRDFDEEFLGLISRGELAAFDDWVPTDVVTRAGIGAMEVLTWVAAANAARELGVATADVTFYEPILEFGVGFGMVEGRA